VGVAEQIYQTDIFDVLDPVLAPTCTTSSHVVIGVFLQAVACLCAVVASELQLWQRVFRSLHHPPSANFEEFDQSEDAFARSSRFQEETISNKLIINYILMN